MHLQLYFCRKWLLGDGIRLKKTRFIIESRSSHYHHKHCLNRKKRNQIKIQPNSLLCISFAELKSAWISSKPCLVVDFSPQKINHHTHQLDKKKVASLCFLLEWSVMTSLLNHQFSKFISTCIPDHLVNMSLGV